MTQGADVPVSESVEEVVDAPTPQVVEEILDSTLRFGKTWRRFSLREKYGDGPNRFQGACHGTSDFRRDRRGAGAAAHRGADCPRLRATGRGIKLVDVVQVIHLERIPVPHVDQR